VQGRPTPVGLPPPTLGQTVRMIGRMGAHLSRTGDGVPGVRTLWRRRPFTLR